nr:uncharacterized protein LOC122271853 [Parasteatoda tepidariorum]
MNNQLLIVKFLAFSNYERSIVAVDDVTILEGSCPVYSESPSTITPSLTATNTLTQVINDETSTEITSSISTIDKETIRTSITTERGSETQPTLTTTMNLIIEPTNKNLTLTFVVVSFLGVTFLMVLGGAALAALTFKRLNKLFP